jgi:hypothetical protein
MIRRWLKIRRLSQYQNRYYDEANYINRLYTLRNLVRDMRIEIEAIIAKER